MNDYRKFVPFFLHQECQNICYFHFFFSLRVSVKFCWRFAVFFLWKMIFFGKWFSLENDFRLSCFSSSNVNRKYLQLFCLYLRNVYRNSMDMYKGDAKVSRDRLYHLLYGKKFHFQFHEYLICILATITLFPISNFLFKSQNKNGYFWNWIQKAQFEMIHFFSLLCFYFILPCLNIYF